MNYKILNIESQLFGRNIIQLAFDTNATEYEMQESNIISSKNPYYIQHQLNANDLTGIHAFESFGFRFIEFRIFRYLQVVKQAINNNYFPFGCELVGDSTANKKMLLKIVAQHNSDDRFTCDPLISDELAQKRLQLYISKSLTSFPRQFVYGLYNKQSNELIGFRTGIFVCPGIVRYFYYFMKKDYNLPNYVLMLESGVIEALVKQKVNIIEAVTSGTNIQEMNNSSLLQKFMVDKTMVLLRKIF